MSTFALPSSLSLHQPGRRARPQPLPRRSAWVLGCLWLLLALLPLRAWASAEMMVSMASPLALPAPMSDTHSVSHPPCHAVADTTPGQPGSSEDEPGHGVGTACGCCLFCASALATVGETPQSIMVAVDPAHTALAVVAPAGEPDPFFRPPRR